MSWYLIMEVLLATSIAALMVWIGDMAAVCCFAAVTGIAFVSGDLSTILDLVAIAAIFGSFFAYNRIKTALIASESAAKAWREERDAALSHVDRISVDLTVLADEKVSLIARVSALESRPDLTRLEGLVAEATAATKSHEINAGARTERLIAAVERISIGQSDAATALKNNPVT